MTKAFVMGSKATLLAAFLLIGILLSSLLSIVAPYNREPGGSSSAFASPTGEPLLPAINSITRTFTFPALKFQGNVASEITMSITWNTNGGVHLSDNRGYQYTLGIPASQGSVTMLENSTMVVQRVSGSALNYEVRWTPVKNAGGFVDRYKFTIEGTSANGGKLSFAVDNNGKYMDIQQSRLLISNIDTQLVQSSLSSTINNSIPRLNQTSQNATVGVSNPPNFKITEGIGLDWSDALAAGYQMAFNSTTKTLDILVGKQFFIDPTTIAQTNFAEAPPTNDYQQGQRRVVKIRNTIFAFFYDGSNILYKYSTDGGGGWLPTSGGISTGTGVIASDSYSWTLTNTTYNASPKIVLAYYSYTGTATDFKVKSGNVNADNSISWTNASPSPLFSDTSIVDCGTGACAAASAATGTDGKVYTVFRWYSVAHSSYVYKIMNSTNGGLNWFVSLDTTVDPSGSLRPTIVLAKLASGKMLLVDAEAGVPWLDYRVFSGTSWGATQSTTNVFTGGTFRQISADSDSTGKPYVAFVTSGNSGALKVETWSNTGGSPSVQPADSTLSHALPQITITGDGVIHVFSIANSLIYETKKVGTKWQTPTNPFGLAFTSPDELTAAISDAYGLWTENSAAPLNVRFGTITPNDLRIDSSGEQRVTYFDGTNNWRFFYDGSTQNIFYQYSPDNGASWSSPVSSLSGALAANSYFGVYGESNTVLITWSTTTAVKIMKGTISGTSVTWSASINVFPVTGNANTNPGQQYFPSFELVGVNLFLGFNVRSGGNNVGYVYTSASPYTTWTQSVNLYTGQSQPGIVGVARYAGASTVAVYALYSDTFFKYRTYNGAAWSGESTTNSGQTALTANALKTNSFSITSDGTCAWIGYTPSNSGGNLRAMQFCGGGNITFSTFINGSPYFYPSISAIDSDIYLYYITGNVIREITYASGSWAASDYAPFGGTFNSVGYLHALKFGYINSNIRSQPVIWRESSTSPFSLVIGEYNAGFQPSSIPTLDCSNYGGDTDQDGICNNWEDGGALHVIYNGVTYTFPCDPVCPSANHKDVYVEVDYTTGFRPYFNSTDNKYTPLEHVKTAFANSPVTNPDQTTGVNLHYIVDEDLGTHQQISMATGGSHWDLKNNYFGSYTERQFSKIPSTERDYVIAKWQIFHYSIFGDTNGWFPGSSGISESAPANDLEITLGGFENSVAQQEGTFMHEMGHNLGLLHGGDEDHPNCKPNYLSVMNYIFQFPDVVGSRPLDYSRSTLASLNESNLSEPDGISASTPPGLSTAYGPTPPVHPTATGVPVDWNTVNGPTETGVQVNINYFESITDCHDGLGGVLHGYNDWQNLRYDFRHTAPGSFQDGLNSSPTDSYHPDMTIDDIRQIRVSMIISLNSAIESLPDSAFIKANTTKSEIRSVLTDHQNGVTALVQKDKLQNALDILLLLRTKMDASSGGNPSDDQVVDHAAQKRILSILDNNILAFKKDLNLA